MVFRPSWQLGQDQFYYNGNGVEIVNTFSYLGLLLNYNGKFNVTQKHIAEMGKKSLFCLMKEVKKHNFNIPTLISLFDTYVSPLAKIIQLFYSFTAAFKAAQKLRKSQRYWHLRISCRKASFSAELQKSQL